MEWLSNRKRIEYCFDCPKRGQECRACDWGNPPGLWDINQDAFDLWKAVLTQWRSAGFEVIGLDYVAVQQEAARMEIELSPCTFQKIKTLERWFIGKSGERDDK